MKRLIIILFALINSLVMFSQGINVTGMELEPTNVIASVNARPGKNDVPCALIIVSLPLDDVTFGDTPVGEVKRVGSDYYVFVDNGCKSLTICHDVYGKAKVTFSRFGIAKVESKCTYRISTQIDRVDMSEYSTVNFISSPSDVNIQLTNTTTNTKHKYSITDGHYRCQLTSGQYSYKAESPGYNSKKGEFSVGEKASEQDVRIDLTSKGSRTVSLTFGQLLSDGNFDDSKFMKTEFILGLECGSVSSGSLDAIVGGNLYNVNIEGYLGLATQNVFRGTKYDDSTTLLSLGFRAGYGFRFRNFRATPQVGLHWFCGGEDSAFGNVNSIKNLTLSLKAEYATSPLWTVFIAPGFDINLSRHSDYSDDADDVMVNSRAYKGFNLRVGIYLKLGKSD